MAGENLDGVPLSSPVRVAVAQAAARCFDLPECVARAERWIARAAEAGAALLVLPEAFLGGYPKGLDFGVRVGTRSDEGRELYRRYHQGAVELDGPEFARLGAAVRRAGLALVVGVIERSGGSLFCTAAVLDEQGALVARHRKLVPTAMERVLWASGDGRTMQVAALGPGRVGTAICWESYMPEYRSHLYRQGVQLYCAPTVDDRETWLPSMQHIAVEGRCYVLSANQFATRADVSGALGEVERPDEVLIQGGSCIVDPFGRVLAGPVRGREELLWAEIELGATLRGKFDLDVSGHYARPDVFRTLVDTGAGFGSVFDDAGRIEAPPEPRAPGDSLHDEED